MIPERFHVIRPEAVRANVFDLFARDWFLITGGTIQSFNFMTASWGGLGHLWDKNVCFIFVRPSRYTFEFLEKHRNFTLSFFEEVYRDKLDLCGSYSGRDTDKVKMSGFTPVESDAGSVFFREARLVYFCRKIYHQDLDPGNFLEDFINKSYSDGDYHRLYIGEIQGCIVR